MLLFVWCYASLFYFLLIKSIASITNNALTDDDRTHTKNKTDSLKKIVLFSFLIARCMIIFWGEVFTFTQMQQQQLRQSNSGRKEGNAMQFELEIQKAYRYRKISGLTEPGSLVWFWWWCDAMKNDNQPPESKWKLKRFHASNTAKILWAPQCSNFQSHFLSYIFRGSI